MHTGKSSNSPGRDVFPMDVGEFLKRDFLKRADITLVCGTSCFSKLIQRATRSPFSHAGLIFLIPGKKSGFEKAFTIDAVPKGVLIKDLGEIVGAAPAKKSKYAVVILRLESTWFDESVQKLVRGRMLDFIKAGYDWSTVFGLFWTIAKGILCGQEKYRGAMQKSLKNHYRQGRLAPANFICSGLVQYGFLKTLYELSQRPESGVDINDARSVIFDQKLRDKKVGAVLGGEPDARAELLATTPEEISRTTVFHYKFLIVDGKVHQVANRAAVIELLKRRRQ